MKRIKGSNGYKAKYRYQVVRSTIFMILLILSIGFIVKERIENRIISTVIEAYEVPALTATPTPTNTPTPTPTISELETVISYITRKFEKEGKDVVIQAINCFYSESGLRPEAQGWNPPKLNPDGSLKEPASSDHGVAQLNDYWHNLTPKQKTDIKANIDYAYRIYKSRGDFSAWYGGRCN
jgi:hypothetical protein